MYIDIETSENRYREKRQRITGTKKGRELMPPPSTGINPGYILTQTSVSHFLCDQTLRQLGRGGLRVSGRAL